ncbi:MAG: DUF1343 domain-containing protein [Candidatus Hinthialibacter antarcticus]|nr:DUF1343 domain-containing protein [Candidatus Hinthialibacter antarcticus]
MKRLALFLFALIVLPLSVQAKVVSGLEHLFDSQVELVSNKRVAVVANHTAVDSKGVHLVDRLQKVATVVAVFAPEHGFRGDVEAGGKVETKRNRDSFSIYSLYGTNRTPTPEMLKGVDVIVYDIQDVGVKFYTYISSLFLVMTAAARDGIPVVVLDRPNPIGGVQVAGPATNPAYTSFVGVIPLPIRYGLTVGELAHLFNNETYAGFTIGCDLTVVKMQGYQRDMAYQETGLPWIAPSPNLPTVESALMYPGTCLFEATNLSEGRGTELPFLTVGAPFIDAKKWLAAVPKDAFDGFSAEPIEFTPKQIPGKSENPKFKNEKCYGLRLGVKSADAEPIRLAVTLICAAKQLYPNEIKTRSFMNLLWGNENLRSMLEASADVDAILKTIGEDTERFQSMRTKYLLYDDSKQNDSGLTPNKIRNGAFQYPFTDNERPDIKFVDGDSEGKMPMGNEQSVYFAKLGQAMDFADLNHDGAVDAVFEMAVNTGGTGTFHYLVCAVSDNGEPKQVAEFFLGDRIAVNKITILTPEVIEIERLKSAPDDAACCPSLKVREYYSFDGGSLSLIGEVKIDDVKY